MWHFLYILSCACWTINDITYILIICIDTVMKQIVGSHPVWSNLVSLHNQLNILNTHVATQEVRSLSGIILANRPKSNGWHHVRKGVFADLACLFTIIYGEWIRHIKKWVYHITILSTPTMYLACRSLEYLGPLLLTWISSHIPSKMLDEPTFGKG